MGKYTMAARRMVEQPVNAAGGVTMASGKPIGRMTPYEVAVKAHGANSFAAKQAAKDVAKSGSGADRVRLNQQLGTVKDKSGKTSTQIAPVSVVPKSPAPEPSKSAQQQASQSLQSTQPVTTSTGGSYNPYVDPLYPTDIKFEIDPNTGQPTQVDPTTGEFVIDPNTGQPRILGTGAGLGMPDATDITIQALEDAPDLVTVADVVSDDGGEAALIDSETGQVGDLRQAIPYELAETMLADDIITPEEIAQIDPTLSAEEVQELLEDIVAAQGEVSEQAQVEAEQLDPFDAASLELDAAQIEDEDITQVQDPGGLQLTEDQLVSGPTVDRQQVADTFGTGEVKAASVKDELADLMEDFESEGTPTWAAGAMRAANAAMAERGLSMTSMAGMAITQAAMEAALPIAQMDAANKQEMALMKAEQRARFMGMEFDQAFQAKVINAARVSEIANMNFNAAQEIALENARLTQTVDLANLSNRQAKIMADAATLSQMDLTNLNNRQQAAVLNAAAFLQMDMSNLDNEQQMTLFKAQEIVNTILSDQSADNAAKQFNAASQNQVDQFYANLASTISQFNSDQMNAMTRFNAGEANALEQFNVQQENARDLFNAQNYLTIAQANAQWIQSITTAANAAANQANRDAAMAANNLALNAYNSVVQAQRDIMAWAWQTADNDAERYNKIAVANIAADGDGAGLIEQASGDFLGMLLTRGLDFIFPAPFSSRSKGL
tara:strand:- start:869 stop:3040 length:2172 start_codon:yes stop_codon:yes gene_type:complete